MAYNPVSASAQEIEKAHQMLDNLEPIQVNEDTFIRFTPRGVQVETGDKVYIWNLVYSGTLQFDGSALDQNSGSGPAYDAGEIGSWK